MALVTSMDRRGQQVLLMRILAERGEGDELDYDRIPAVKPGKDESDETISIEREILKKGGLAVA